MTIRGKLLCRAIQIYGYKIEALEHSINTNVFKDKLNIIHIPRLSQTFPPFLTSIMSFKRVTLDVIHPGLGFSRIKPVLDATLAKT